MPTKVILHSRPSYLKSSVRTWITRVRQNTTMKGGKRRIRILPAFKGDWHHYSGIFHWKKRVSVFVLRCSSESLECLVIRSSMSSVPWATISSSYSWPRWTPKKPNPVYQPTDPASPPLVTYSVAADDQNDFDSLVSPREQQRCIKVMIRRV